jgi:hypothetical protein
LPGAALRWFAVAVAGVAEYDKSNVQFELFEPQPLTSKHASTHAHNREGNRIFMGMVMLMEGLLRAKGKASIRAGLCDFTLDV